MPIRRELCNLENPDEASLLVDIIGKSLKNSEHTLTEGLRSSQFLDLDLSLADINISEKLTDTIASKFKTLEQIDECKIDKIALIDKGDIGPVGLISLKSSLSKKVNKESIIVRIQKYLVRSAIKGELTKGDNVAILSDIATTGFTIHQAAQKIWAYGGKIAFALVVIDRLQGATENLGRKGIHLISLTSVKSLDESKREEIIKKYERTIEYDYEPSLKDFGGKSSTVLTY